MFQFQDIVVGTDGYQRMFKKLCDLAGQGIEVEYEEYVTNPGTKMKATPVTWMGNNHSVVDHRNREVKCRGFART